MGNYLAHPPLLARCAKPLVFPELEDTVVMAAAANVRSAKKLLRSEMKRILNAMTDEAKEKQSAAVAARLLGDQDYKVPH